MKKNNRLISEELKLAENKAYDKLNNEKGNIIVSLYGWDKVVKEMEYTCRMIDKKPGSSDIEEIEESDVKCIATNNEFLESIDKERVTELNGETKYVNTEKDTPEDVAEWINEFSNEHTHGKIKNIIRDSDLKPWEYFAYAIINSIYLKAKWHSIIEVNKSDITFNNQKVKGLSSMEYFRYYQSKCGTYVSIPFEGGCSFVVFKPDDYSSVDVKEVADELNGIEWEYKHIWFKMPEIHNQYSLDHTCKFCTDENHVTDIQFIQKATIDCDYTGVEASSTTVGIRRISGCCLNITQPMKIWMEKPFIYFIVKDDIILFAGKKNY